VKTKGRKFEIRINAHPRYLAVDRNVARRLARIARKRKVPAEVLANLWIQEKLLKAS
jgi:hypothetical protein